MDSTMELAKTREADVQALRRRNAEYGNDTTRSPLEIVGEMEAKVGGTNNLIAELRTSLAERNVR